MAADAAGNDLGAVFIPVTGNIAIAPFGTAVPSPADGAKATVTLAEVFEKLGLFAEDGGFEWTEEASGDPIVFFQQGYSIPSGEANVQVVVKLAETSRKNLETVRGTKFDENNHTIVDASGNPLQYVVWTEEIAKNGNIRRRACENATVASWKEDKDERGTVKGIEVTWTFKEAAGHPSGQFHEWFLTPADLTPAP